MARQTIINASPLIFLSRGSHLELLRVFAEEVWVPEPVAGEILQRGPEDITARMIEKTDWLIRVPVDVISNAISEWRLGAGESSVLALALQHPETYPSPYVAPWASYWPPSGAAPSQGQGQSSKIW